MPHTRRHRDAVHYLQYRTSAEQAIARASAALKAAYAAVAACDPALQLLEGARADIEIALREARGMANLDGAAVTGCFTTPAGPLLLL
jgi:hypothetical protein